MITRFLFIIFCLHLYLPLHADDPVNTVQNKHVGKFLLLPVLYNSPETRWSAGIVTAITFKTNLSDSLLRTSSLQTLLMRTQRKQTITGLEGTIFFPLEKYILRFHQSYTDYPDKYWGLGNNTPDQNLEKFSYNQVYIFPQLLKKINAHFYSGISLEYQHIINFKYKHGGLFEAGNLTGIKESNVSGIGIIFSRDSRNNAFTPTDGSLLEVTATAFDEVFGSAYEYTNLVVDIRKFILLQKKNVLGVQLFCNFNHGQVPFLSLAALGGNSIMRGFYSGRFRDNNMVATQAEYRLQLSKKFGVTAFGAAGRVTNDIRRLIKDDDRSSQDSGADFKLAGGGGIRYKLREKESLNIRLDFGITKYSHGLYFTVGEAF
jgi:outer membrane protein assembly factor BamA